MDWHINGRKRQAWLIMLNLQRFAGPIVQIMQQTKNMLIMVLDQEFKLVEVNEAFLGKMYHSGLEMGTCIRKLLVPASNEALLAAADKDYSFLRLNFAFQDGVLETLDTHCHRIESGWLLVGERLMVTGSDVLTELSQLNNELVNISRELRKKNRELQDARDKVRTLSGLLPICSYCKKIRDDKGYWDTVEGYISSKSDASFSHGICPCCLKKNFPEYADELLAEDNINDPETGDR